MKSQTALRRVAVPHALAKRYASACEVTLFLWEKAQKMNRWFNRRDRFLLISERVMCLSDPEDGVASWYVAVADIRALYVCPKEICLGVQLRDGSVLVRQLNSSSGGAAAADRRSGSSSSSAGSTSGTAGGRQVYAVPVDLALFFPHINVLHHVQEVIKTIACCLTGVVLPVYPVQSVSDMVKQLILRPDGCRVKQPKMKLSQKSSRAVWATPDLFLVSASQDTPLQDNAQRSAMVSGCPEEYEPWYCSSPGAQREPTTTGDYTNANPSDGCYGASTAFKRRRVFKRRLPQRQAPGGGAVLTDVDATTRQGSSGTQRAGHRNLFGDPRHDTGKDPYVSHVHEEEDKYYQHENAEALTFPAAVLRSPDGSWLLPSPAPSSRPVSSSGPLVPTSPHKIPISLQRGNDKTDALSSHHAALQEGRAGEAQVHHDHRRHHHHRPCSDSRRDRHTAREEVAGERRPHRHHQSHSGLREHTKRMSTREQRGSALERDAGDAAFEISRSGLPPRSACRNRTSESDAGAGSAQRIDDGNMNGDIDGPLFSPVTPRSPAPAANSSGSRWADKMLQDHKEKQWCMVSCSSDSSSVVSVLSSSFRGSV